MLLKSLIAMLLAAVAFGQAATLSVSNPSTPPQGGYIGGAVIPLVVTKSGNPTATGVQFNITPAPGVQSITVTLGAGIPAGSKSVTCNPFAPYTCIVVGLNTTAIPDGVIATATVTLATTITSSPVNITISAPIEVDGGANALPTTLGNPTVSLLIKSGCDVNGDGSVGSADLSQVTSQAILGSTSTTTDLDKNGVTNVIDSQIVATAATPPAFTCLAK